MEFTKLLEERRSIRAFDPEKHVTAEQIQEIVQAAICLLYTSPSPRDA